MQSRSGPVSDEHTNEEIIDPSLPIVDAHHHLGDRPGHRYLLDELLGDVRSGHNVRATVYVESGVMWRADGPEPFRPVGETEFANGVAAMSASGHYGTQRLCAAIVGYADLREPRIEQVLDSHIQAGGGRFRGIRQRSYWHSSPEIMRHFGMRPERELLEDGRFRAGFAALIRKDLTFDAVLFHTQIPELTALARAFPNARIILNHLGLPLRTGPYADKHAEVFAAWKASLATLATCPNVMVKIGGMAMPLWGFDFNYTQMNVTSEQLANFWQPFFETCVDLFGSDRCMLESNFPVDAVFVKYTSCWNAFKIITKRYSDFEKRALFSNSCREFYKIAS